MKPLKIPYYKQFVATNIRNIEFMVMVAIAVILVVLAVLLLGNSVLAMWRDLVEGSSITTAGIEILNTILLVIIIMEIVHTVATSLESRSLGVIEPYLIIGAIAAIRRTLAITVESTKLELTNPDAFRSLLMEIGLLGLFVIGMVVSIFILRRSTNTHKTE
ncbi:MAG: phosphate-starvation-inducible PsiE family protein [Syntrophales bacterium]